MNNPLMKIENEKFTKITATSFDALKAIIEKNK